jgi:hypothetical protein
MNIETLYASGLVVDFAIVFTVLELASLWAYHRWTGRGRAPDAYLINGLSGLSFWMVMAISLIAAGIVHFIDLFQRASQGSKRIVQRQARSLRTEARI